VECRRATPPRHGQRDADPEEARVGGHFERTHREARRVARDDSHERVRQHHTQHSACAAKHQALGQQRPPERAGARAKRSANRQFAFAAHRARKDQIRDVRARDDEHNSGSSEEHQQNRPCRRYDLIAERRDAQLNIGPG
jgi:hypothetical protein